PSQFSMDDVEMATGDKNLITTLANIYHYHKVPVPFTGIKNQMECPHLGGNYERKMEKKVVKKAMKNEEVRY
ncbi:MAG: FMN-binding glutamate synthase family protein, partial [Marinirhabdus sp.]|nr:FMN-binding glutamate synthase family protein [Marinirhabdus sp.]